WLTSLRSLALGGVSYYGTKGLKALAKAPWLPGLVELDLFGFKLGTEGVKALAAAPLTGVRNLELAHSKLDDTRVFALLEATWLGGLLKLDLSTNAIGSAGATALVEAPQLDGLLHLRVRKNQFPEALGERFRERFGERVVLKWPFD